VNVFILNVILIFMGYLDMDYIKFKGYDITYPTKVYIVNDISNIEIPGIYYYVKSSDDYLLLKIKEIILNNYLESAKIGSIHLTVFLNNININVPELSMYEADNTLSNNINYIRKNKIRSDRVLLLNNKLRDILSLYFIRKNVLNIINNFENEILDNVILSKIGIELENFKRFFDITAVNKSFYNLEFVIDMEEFKIYFELEPILSYKYYFHIDLREKYISEPYDKNKDILENFDEIVEKYL